MTTTTQQASQRSGASVRPPGAPVARKRMVVPPRRRAHAPQRGEQAPVPLGRYASAAGRPREIVVCAGAAGSALVIDRDALTLGERRLVAHLAPDEPPGNARVACARYLADPTRGRCRPVQPSDLEAPPFAAQEQEEDREPHVHAPWPSLGDERGRRYRIAPVLRKHGLRELRWCEAPRTEVPCGAAPPGPGTTPLRGEGPVLSLRAVVGRLESYEPACALTRRTVNRFWRDPVVSVSTLAAELHRVQSSSVVLNRGLREAVLGAIEREGLSLSEIAIRCGRVKRGAPGTLSGESTWIARRVGLAPDAGKRTPTPWVHSDVLGLIARQGLGLSPREVELG